MELPPDEAAYFWLREDGKNDFKLPPGKGEEHEAAVRLVVQRAVDMIHTRFGGTGKAILLVGHGNSGKVLLEMLTNKDLADSSEMANTGMWMVEEQRNGQFKLEMYNDAADKRNEAVSAEHR